MHETLRATMNQNSAKQQQFYVVEAQTQPQQHCWMAKYQQLQQLRGVSALQQQDQLDRQQANAEPNADSQNNGSGSGGNNKKKKKKKRKHSFDSIFSLGKYTRAPINSLAGL